MLHFDFEVSFGRLRNLQLSFNEKLILDGHKIHGIVQNIAEVSCHKIVFSNDE